MPKQPPAPKHAPAIPLSGSIGGVFPSLPSLSPKTRTRSETQAIPAVQARTDVQARADAEARSEAITRYYFYAFILLNFLGLAAMGYALLTM